MILKRKALFSLLVAICLASGLSQLMNINASSMTSTAGDDWSSYEPISDENLNSTNYRMVLDSTDNVHIFWQRRNDIENFSQLIYQIRFTNNTIKTSTIFDWENNTSYYLLFEVDIDASDVLHLIFANASVYSYYKKFGDNWVFQSEVTLTSVNNFCFTVVQSIPHIIYTGSTRGNIFDVAFKNNNWQTTQITNYVFDSNEYYSSSKFPKITKSLKGKIAICFYHQVFAVNPPFDGTVEIQMIILDKEWSDPITIETGFADSFSIDFDESEQLHIIWYKTYAKINYATYKRRLSDTSIVTLSLGTRYSYNSILHIDIELQGTTRLIAFTISKFTSPFVIDYDLFLVKSTDGVSWNTEIICSANNTKSLMPIVESTKDGTVFVLADESGYGNDYNKTISFGYKENYFSYQPMTVNFEPIIVLLVLPVIALIYKRKTRK